METEKKGKIEKISHTGGALQKIFGIFLRWFYLMVIIISSVYAVWIWKKYILNADWSEEKKRAYISEQSVLSFDENKYQKDIFQILSTCQRPGLGNPRAFHHVFVIFCFKIFP